MLAAAATALILSPLLVLGNFFEYVNYPTICKNETLTLKGCCSGTVSKNAIESPSLRCLTLNSDIRSFEEGSFDRVPNLIYLNLEGNLIPPDKLFSFGNISNITALSLNGQRYDDRHDVRYDDEYGDVEYVDDEDHTVLEVNTVYPKLLYLNLRNAKISKIINPVFNPFPQLSYLDLSHNTFSSVNFIQLWNNSLTHLNLDDNKISQISLDKLNNLIWLSLEDNSFESIGDGYNLDLRGLSNLEYLSIVHNRINHISEAAFNHTVKLRYLNISNNALTALSPKLFTPLTSLEVLMLDDNDFNDIPLIISSNITTLSLNCNNIRSLMSSSLDTLPHLRMLSLARNKISNIYPEMFKSQGLLEELYLDDNKLTYLPSGWYQYMKKLRYLNLSGNKFTSIESVFDSADTPLKEVYLRDNDIESIETGILKTLPQNVTIYLYMNWARPQKFCKHSLVYY